MNVQIDIQKLESKDPKVKYAFAKELLQLSESSPESLYPYFGKWLDLLQDENNVIKWTAIDIIGNLSVADKENHINEEVLNVLIDLLHHCKLITCNHAVYALGIIALHKPEFKERIINELLSVRNNDFETDDCEDIAMGKVLEALTPLINEIRENKKATDFIKIASTCQKNSTRKKAEELLKELNK